MLQYSRPVKLSRQSNPLSIPQQHMHIWLKSSFTGGHIKQPPPAQSRDTIDGIARGKQAENLSDQR